MRPSIGPSIGHWTRDWAEARALPCEFHESTGSTNDLARENGPHRDGLMAVAPLALYVADAQTAGRGRGGRAWQTAAPGSSLLSTWSFDMPLSPQPILSPLVGLSLFRALRGAFPELALSLKAPNDVWSGPAKVAGVLIETVEVGARRRSAIGIGLNVWAAPESPDFAAAALVASATELTPLAWFGFLDTLHEGLRGAVGAGQGQTLVPEARRALRDALNLRPGLEERVLEVGSQGELSTSGGLVRWQDL